MPFTYRDKPSLSERLRGKSGDQLFQDLEKELEDNRKMFFETSPTWGTTPRSGSFSRSVVFRLVHTSLRPFIPSASAVICLHFVRPEMVRCVFLNVMASEPVFVNIYPEHYRGVVDNSSLFPMFQQSKLKGFISVSTLLGQVSNQDELDICLCVPTDAKVADGGEGRVLNVGFSQNEGVKKSLFSRINLGGGWKIFNFDGRVPRLAPWLEIELVRSTLDSCCDVYPQHNASTGSSVAFQVLLGQCITVLHIGAGCLRSFRQTLHISCDEWIEQLLGLDPCQARKTSDGTKSLTFLVQIT
uniref:Uncharacterized protein n=1 Tax=Timema poppense TaxID=170557 RepID=A0A7R9DG61_TIMPO|nr:unnamed protein product [Timema poppensis]